MKKLLFLITVISFSFTMGTMWVGFDGTPELSSNALDGDLESGGMILGYNHPLHASEDGKKSLWAGTAIYMCDMDVNGYDNWGYLSWYALPMYSINEKFAAWGSFGYARVFNSSSESTADSGLQYGLGLHYRVNDTYGMGVGYMVNTNEVSTMGDMDAVVTDDYEVSRLTVYLTKSLAGMFK